MTRSYITVSIPYVNAQPHVGYALELVEADVLARQRRATGGEVRFLGGTDDHALKNVLGAEAAGVPTQDFVDANAAAFAALRDPLRVSFDDFIRTSRDPRHRAGVERLWHASAANGDFYRKWYEGPYCVGCERFYAPAELLDGCCPEHGTPAETVAEENWFFRLSRYQQQLVDLIEEGTLEIVPETYRNEVLAFLDVRPRRHQRVALADAGTGLGDPGPRRSLTGDLRVVGRARELRHRARLRNGRRSVRHVVAHGRRAHPRGGQGDRALPRGVLAGDAAVGG